MLLLFGWMACLSGGPAVPTVEVTPGPFEVVLPVQGELQAVRSVTVNAPRVTGSVKVAWVIEEGSVVEIGDELIRFDDTELKRQLDTEANKLEVAQTKMAQRRAQLKEKLGDQRTAIRKSELSLQSAQMRVTDSDTVPRVDREAARISVEEATLSLETARSSMRAVKLEGESAVALLRLEAEQASNGVAQAQEALDKAVVLAEQPGLVILPEVWKGGSRGPVAAGDTVWRGTPVIELPDMSEMRVVAWVHEVDAAQVEVGQDVSVVVDAHPDPAHAGTVDKVANLAIKRDQNRAVKHLRVDISLDETADVMKPGMTVRAEIRVAALEDVISVPQEAVFHQDGQATVFVQGSFGSWERVPVELGIDNDASVVIESGLEPGQIVALADPDAAEAGEPVRPGVPGGAEGS